MRGRRTKDSCRSRLSIISCCWIGRGGNSRGQARGDSRSPGPNRGQAGDQSIELGGHRAQFRSTLQAGGGATELADRCRGAALTALVPGQGRGSNRLCVGRRLDARRSTDISIRLSLEECCLARDPSRDAVSTAQLFKFSRQLITHTRRLSRSGALGPLRASERNGASLADRSDQRVYGCRASQQFMGSGFGLPHQPVYGCRASVADRSDQRVYGCRASGLPHGT